MIKPGFRAMILVRTMVNTPYFRCPGGQPSRGVLFQALFYCVNTLNIQ
jgi:hypothetical protein